jgi:hypothetical protein
MNLGVLTSEKLLFLPYCKKLNTPGYPAYSLYAHKLYIAIEIIADDFPFFQFRSAQSLMFMVL